MQEPIDVTVVTPTIPGREELLEQCKESVRQQTMAPVNHIVGLDKDREGPGATRNRLALDVDTEWITFLDDDDTLMPGHFEVHEEYMREISGTAISRVGDKKGVKEYGIGSLNFACEVIATWCVIVEVDGTENIFLGAPNYKSLLGGQNTLPMTATIKTDMFRSVGGFGRSKRLEDLKLWRSIYRANGAIRVIHIPTWYYRLQPDGRNVKITK